MAGDLTPVAPSGHPNRLAQWDGTTWSEFTVLNPVNGISRQLNSFLTTSVSALAVFDDGSEPALYAAGSLDKAGGVPANSIAKWDGSTWSPLGSGMNDTVRSLTVFDDGAGPALYAGGRFWTAGGVSADRIAKWNGSTWSAMGNVVSRDVFALTVFDDGTGPALYAGGEFYIGQWNGSTWSTLGFGTDLGVFALTGFDDGTGPALYVGGDFTTIGGVSANRIAKWDGSTWSSLGSGMNDTVRSLTVFDDGTGPALYAGGGFTTAGGFSRDRIAKWDGSTWSRLGISMRMYGNVFGGVTVFALTVFDNGTGPALYVGGDFTEIRANGLNIHTNSIAKWDGAIWSKLTPEGGTGPVSALAAFHLDTRPALYVGGDFLGAGGKQSSYIAAWRVLSADCNDNGVSDECEIDMNSTAPGGPFCCDPNSPPFGLTACDPDCNDNGIPDACDSDCNETGIPDSCEEFIDDNDNGIPDECDCWPTVLLTNPAMVDAGFGGASRFLSLLAGDPGRRQAISVTFPDPMPSPYMAWSGLQMWVGPPVRFCENSGQAVAPSNIPPSFGCDPAPGLPQRWYMASILQCDAHFMDWHGVCEDGVCVGGLREGLGCTVDTDCLEPVYVFHEGIIPSTGPHNVSDPFTPTTYTLHVINQACDLALGSDYSVPLNLTTSKWGDTVEDLQDHPYAPPEGRASLLDVLAQLAKFQNTSLASVSARVDLIGGEVPNYLPDHKVTIGDVVQGIFAFTAEKYPSAAITGVPTPRPCE